MSNFIDRILLEVCLDERVQDGIFDLSNDIHMDVLRENLVDKFGLSLENARSIHNKMLEGKYPERQAYNKDGLLVTFPTPQHKQKAIQRGTHFEKDPTGGAQNVFAGDKPAQGGQPAAQAPAPAPSQTPAEPQQNIFPQSQQTPTPPAPASPAPASVPTPAPAQAPAQQTSLPKSDTPAIPTNAPAPTASALPSSLPTSDMTPSAASDKQKLSVEPQASAGQTATPAAPPNFQNPKPPEQRAAEAQVVKQMFMGDKGDQTLSSTFPLNVTEQFRALSLYAESIGYKEAAKFLLEIANRK